MRYSFVIDHSRCIGCHACSLACKAEHDVPLGSYRTWVKYVEKGTFPDVRRFFTVLRCNHCEIAPCVEICPVTALYRRDDGIVDFDREVCIGCKACMLACPYDALYIHPDHGTAEKCNFCSHRIEIDLEPPCATVCPTEAILVGDLDDPRSRVAQIVNTRPVDVRKPEKGTLPKVFYIQAEPRALTPGTTRSDDGYLWAEQSSGCQPPVVEATPPVDERLATESASTYPGTEIGSSARGPDAWLQTDLPPAAAMQAMAAPPASQQEFFSGAWAGLSPARTVYDVAHPRAWGWRVSGYLWTKSISAGAFLIAALAPWLDLHQQPGLAAAAALVGLLFLAITTVLLITDLKRPARFYTILTRPNMGSWLAKGAFVLTAFGLVGSLWTGAEVALLRWSPTLAVIAEPLLTILRWPLVLLAAASAGYSGYLFAQAKGRDYWQSSLLPLHLIVQAAAAGAAVGVLLQAAGGAAAVSLAVPMTVAIGVHLALVAFGEITVPHVSRDAESATKALVTGPLKGWFWSGVVSAAVAMALIVAGGSGAPLIAAVGAVIVLIALALYDHAWLLAGQAVPLS